MLPFDTHESAVRAYCRDIPIVFDRANGSFLYDESGRAYLDFFAGAGALNYGHNHPHLVDALQNYLAHGGVSHSLDLHSAAKGRFIDTFVNRVLAPRDLNHRMMFPGPTGTNAIEAAMKIARKATGRQTIAAFTGGFHGMTLGALAATANAGKRAGAGVGLDNVIRLPFDGFLPNGQDSFGVIEAMLTRPGAGLDAPAAILIETLQCEGGLNHASAGFLRSLSALCQKIGSLLIIDDIQAGCGRTGSFFSFEHAGIRPDIVCLSKSLSGLGLPLSIVLVAPQHDVLAPGEHNGTFRGYNHAFVTATAALDFWNDQSTPFQVPERADELRNGLAAIASDFSDRITGVRGLGMAQGLAMRSADQAKKVTRAALSNGMIMETCGALDDIVKLMPPINISADDLSDGLGRLRESVTALSSAAA